LIKMLKPSDMAGIGLGNFMLLYGPPDTGKTHNILESLYRAKLTPILHLMGGSKGDDVDIILQKIKMKDEDITCVPLDEETVSTDLLDFLFDDEQCKPFKSIFFDDFTHHMVNTMHNEVEDQHFLQKAKDKKVNMKTLAAMVKTSVENHGIVNNLTKRIFRAMGNRSKQGKVCIIATHYDEQVKWGGEFVGGPNFSGKQIGKEFIGHFGKIGRVVERFERDKDNNLIRDKSGFPNKLFPPIVYFKSDGTFIARGGGIGLLDLGKILNVDKKKPKE
jgi:hypothetical protein